MDSPSLLRILRDYMNLSRAEMARLLSVDQASESRFEKGDRQLNFDHLDNLSKATALPVYVLVLLGSPDELKKFLKDGADASLEAEFPVKVILAIRQNLIRLKEAKIKE